jgi:hypothetical protein
VEGSGLKPQDRWDNRCPTETVSSQVKHGGTWDISPLYIPPSRESGDTTTSDAGERASPIRLRNGTSQIPLPHPSPGLNKSDPPTKLVAFVTGMEEMERNPFGEVRLRSPAGLLFSHIEDVREAPLCE